MASLFTIFLTMHIFHKAVALCKDTCSLCTSCHATLPRAADSADSFVNISSGAALLDKKKKLF